MLVSDAKTLQIQHQMVACLYIKAPSPEKEKFNSLFCSNQNAWFILA